MDAERWQRIKTVLEAVDGRSPEERRAIVADACAGDDELRRQIEGYLEHEERLSGFIEEPVLPFLAERPEEPPVERRIGPYRTLRLLGRGGMGTVYLAVREDEFEQRVALKLLPAGLDTADMIRRFHHERQILARLEHPHIARLLDGGTSDDGLPYFAMEYVEGLPIDRYCDAHELTVGQRLELVLKVCSALEFAHRNLVIHRDLKPSNILVGADGVPKLLDFGIAKLVAPGTALGTYATLPGQRPMTLRYASPEQFREEPITTASDIYSLGLLLYLLLTGRLPCRLESHSFPRVMQVVCDEEPARPSEAVDRSEEIPVDDASAVVLTPESVARARGADPRTLVRRLAGDVDAIVMKALRKEPRHRYGSVEQLAEDVRRHLGGLPVTARQGTLTYLTAKFVRRHRWGLATAAAVLLLAAGFTAALVVQLDRTSRQRDRAERVSSFLVDLFAAANPDLSAGEAPTAQDLLDRGRSKLEAGLEEEPEVRATLLNTLGRVYLALGDYDEAMALMESALEIRRPLGDDGVVAEMLNDLGAVHLALGDDAAAAPLLREAVALRRRLGDEENLMKPMNNLATILLRRGELAEAEELYRQGLTMRRARWGDDHPNVATSLRSLATVLLTRGELAAAEPLLYEALAIRRRAYGAGSPAAAAVLSTLGRLEQARGRLDEAEALFTETLDVRRRELGEDHPFVALTEKDLASLLLERGEVDTAEVLLTQALETLYRTKPADDWSVADAESVLGELLAARSRYREAEVCLRRSYETLLETRGAEALYTRDARRRLEALELPGSKRQARPAVTH